MAEPRRLGCTTGAKWPWGVAMEMLPWEPEHGDAAVKASGGYRPRACAGASSRLASSESVKVSTRYSAEMAR